MAIRNIVKLGDEILTKKCREVKEINDRIICLLDDMAETLKDANGAGLAAPQVGVLKRIAVVIQAILYSSLLILKSYIQKVNRQTPKAV